MLCFFNVFFLLKIFYSYTEKTQQKRQRKQYKTKQTKETMYSEQLYTIAILATNKSNQAVELITVNRSFVNYFMLFLIVMLHSINCSV